MSTTTAAQYRKKPVIVDAIQWNGTADSTIRIEIFMQKDLTIQGSGLEGMLRIPTLEGETFASIGDFVIRE